MALLINLYQPFVKLFDLSLQIMLSLLRLFDSLFLFFEMLTRGFSQFLLQTLILLNYFLQLQSCLEQLRFILKQFN
jgi:hypothetical protein